VTSCENTASLAIADARHVLRTRAFTRRSPSTSLRAKHRIALRQAAASTEVRPDITRQAVQGRLEKGDVIGVKFV
jgi:aconitase A